MQFFGLLRLPPVFGVGMLAAWGEMPVQGQRVTRP